MEIDATKIYMMPLIMGPRYDKNKLPGLNYPNSEIFAVQFETSKDSVREIIPDCYALDDVPVVTVLFAYHQGLSFLSGGGYHLAAYQITATFLGNKDAIKGNYIPIMFENMTTPILGGRELLGVPKLYADIPPFRIIADGTVQCDISLWGHFLYQLEIPLMKKQNAIIKKIANRKINKMPWLAYKYIPSLDGPADADYPTITRNDVHIKELWLGKTASIHFNTLSEDQIGMAIHIIDALKSIPILKIKQVLHFRGSAVLRLDKSHRLN